MDLGIPKGYQSPLVKKPVLERNELWGFLPGPLSKMLLYLNHKTMAL
uniref:Uncharacterized protein n=1 Tax=Arundo donax TaxID=35708 RepID=A0A0A9HR19_ARUDO